jgi:hypothetical protein
MNPVATFIRRPFKKGEDYFEYIALDGAVRVFDIDLAEPFWGRTDRTRFEAMFRSGQGRWVLMFLAFPCEDLPPWQAPKGLGEGDEPSELPTPPSRELAPDQAAWWLRENQDVLPDDLEPVALDTYGPDQLGRLDHAWRPDAAPPRAPSPSPVAPAIANADRACEVPRRTKRRRFRRGELDDIATAKLLGHPERSNREIAEDIGCHPKTLSHPRMERFLRMRAAFAAQRQRYAGGFKDPRTGRIEAEEDDRDKDD